VPSGYQVGIAKMGLGFPVIDRGSSQPTKKPTVSPCPLLIQFASTHVENRVNVKAVPTPLPRTSRKKKKREKQEEGAKVWSKMRGRQ